MVLTSELSVFVSPGRPLCGGRIPYSEWTNESSETNFDLSYERGLHRYSCNPEPPNDAVPRRTLLSEP